MSVLFLWRWDNYSCDMAKGKAFHLNQNNELLFNLKPGSHIWAFTRLDKTYVLATDLVVSQTQINPPKYKYGKYRALADKQRSRYFDVHKGANVEPLIRSLSIRANAKILGQSFQGERGVKQLNDLDEQKLVAFSANLPTI